MSTFGKVQKGSWNWVARDLAHPLESALPCPRVPVFTTASLRPIGGCSKVAGPPPSRRSGKSANFQATPSEADQVPGRGQSAVLPEETGPNREQDPYTHFCFGL